MNYLFIWELGDLGSNPCYRARIRTRVSHVLWNALITGLLWEEHGMSPSSPILFCECSPLKMHRNNTFWVELHLTQPKKGLFQLDNAFQNVQVQLNPELIFLLFLFARGVLTENISYSLSYK